VGPLVHFGAGGTVDVGRVVGGVVRGGVVVTGGGSVAGGTYGGTYGSVGTVAGGNPLVGRGTTGVYPLGSGSTGPEAPAGLGEAPGGAVSGGAGGSPQAASSVRIPATTGSR
jgi:hypothetical protein